MRRCDFAIVMRGGAQETIERFLKQVVGQLAIARDAGQIRPHTARGPLVECTEGVFVHHESGGGAVECFGPADIGKSNVTEHK